MAKTPPSPDRDTAGNAAGISPPPRRQFLIFLGFLVWSALVMTAFLLNSAGHLLGKLKEFGVL